MNRRAATAAGIAIAALAGLLLFWNLTEKYLWQDEAATAVLSQNLLKFGRPLAYDGVNLVTIDYFLTEEPETIAQRTKAPRPAIDYYIQRGDLYPDTAWKWQPWGQFVVAAAGLKLLGETTLGARLPFALAGLFCVGMLYWLVLRVSRSIAMAAIAALLLVFNSYWILHARQCRYYSVSSLLLVMTIAAYLRWQRARPWGASLFIVVAWCWFQVDYGTVWPVFGILFVNSFWARRRTVRQTLVAGMGLTASIAPFLLYYQLWGRHMEAVRPRLEIFWINLFNTNEYVAPVVLVILAAFLLSGRWQHFDSDERHLVAISCAVVFALLLWVPAVTPEAFLRYVVMAAPLGGLITAWLLVRACGPRLARLAWLGFLILAVTPWASLPVRLIVPDYDEYYARSLWRDELGILKLEVFGHRPDPNRLTVEWLRQNAAPTDEILANYEDLPLVFYLPNPIRGGIAAFRAEDDARTPPRFAVIRQSVPFVHIPVFEREMARYQWEAMPPKIPDIIWGNNPEPMMWEQYPAEMPYLQIQRRK